MGLTHVNGDVTGPAGSRAGVRLPVDSGATDTTDTRLPGDVWTAIGLAGRRKTLSQSAATLPVAWVGDAPSPEAVGGLAKADRRSGHLSEAGDGVLLGVVTPEILGLVSNPFTWTPQPVRLMPA